MTDDLTPLLRASIERNEMQKKLDKQAHLIATLQIENATLRQRLRAEFDLASDGLPMPRGQAG